MSKRQRRRVSKRRAVHMDHVKQPAGLVRRLSIAVAAAVAGPAIAAPAAQAAPRAHHFDGSAIRAVGFDMPKALANRAHHAHRLADASDRHRPIPGHQLPGRGLARRQRFPRQRRQLRRRRRCRR